MTAPLRIGVIAALITAALDQGSKLWLLYGYELGRRGIVKVLPGVDLVLAWNTGISYGWLQSESAWAQGGLFAVKVIAVILLAVWMARSTTRLATLGLGLIIGGAIGNAIDRLMHGAVVDFVMLHAEIGGKTWNWYVFNLADVAIVAGVIGLLYDSLRAPDAAKAP